MAIFKVLVVLGVAAFAAVLAAEEAKRGEKITEKKDVAMMMMVPGQMMIPAQMKYADDDGSYWPGKYDRSMPVMPAAYRSDAPAMSAVHPMPVMSPMHSAMFPYAYSHMPISRSYVF